MKLHTPFEISPRLLPGLRIGGAWVQLEYSKRAGREGRIRYQWTIDLPDGREFTGDDLQSGCGGGSLQGGFASLLSFLGAFAEAHDARHGGELGDNADLFPKELAEWATQNDDEISCLSLDVEELGGLILE